MAYSSIEKRSQLAIVVDQGESTGDKLTIGFKRPATILGWGLVVAAAYATETTNMVVALDHDPAASARVEKDTFTISDGAALGTAIERSELMRGRSPVAPNAVLAAFDVLEGDLVIVEVTTANSAGAGEPLFYVLVAEKGSF
jgi:hypothetical protein